MKLQQLEYVAAVEKYGSFSKAAQKLYISQPSISNSIQALEEELGIIIFKRSAKGTSITEDGRELLKLSHKLMRDVEYIEEYFGKNLEEKTKSFFVSGQHYVFMVDAFSEFIRNTENLPYRFGLNQTKTAQVIDDVKKQYSNLGIIYLSNSNRIKMEKTLKDSNIEFHLLLETKPHVYLSKNHPLSNKIIIKTSQLLDYPCISYEQDLEDPGFFSEEIMIPDFYPEKMIYISDFYASKKIMEECLAYDIGTGLLSKSLRDNLTCRPIEVDDVVQLGWIAIKGKELNNYEKEFLLYLEKAISDIVKIS